MDKEYYKYFEEDLVDRSLDKSQKPEDMRGRLVAFAGAMVIAFSVLLGRLWFMQVMDGPNYQKLAESNRRRVIPIEAPRGYIYDRNRKIFISNRPGLAISVLPTVVQVNKEVLERLAKLTGLSVKEITDKLSEKNADPLKPRIIKRDVDKRVVAYLGEHQSDFPGVDLTVETIREYPFGNLAAHLVGYLGEASEQELKEKKSEGYDMGDVVGKAGVEKTYEWALRGTKGSQQVEVNAAGRPLRILKSITPNPGHNLVLTLDLDLQQTAEKGLADAINVARQGKYKKANAGAAVVLDPRNGEVLALASYPSYDPKLFLGGISSKNWAVLTDKSSGYPLNDRAIMATYPPGSTFKMITAIGALSDGLTTPERVFVDSGTWSVFGEQWAKKCWLSSGHGSIDFISAIAQSCDTVFYQLGYEFEMKGGERLQYWARDVFGLGNPTGIDLPSETVGRVPDRKWKKEFNKEYPEYQTWYPGDTVNISIGQGDLLVTPLQLALSYAAIANGGNLYKPHVVRAVVNNDGKVIYEVKPEARRKIPVGPEAIAVMKAGLGRVTRDGTASGAFSGFPVPVAGKTGTSEVQGKDDFAWFVGYAPADDPKYLAVVVVEQGGHGGSAAAPVVRSILAKALDIKEESMIKAEDISR
ncbi:MAG: penicillin-binding protein 2 [Actinobacteria bacterium]|nr:penicillin-binding protein 2 [Actinomycetota bacterium]